MEANRIVETLGLVERGPDGLRISDRYPALQALTDRVVESSRKQEQTKLDLGLLDPEGAAIRRDMPGAVIRGQDVVPGERLHTVLPHFPHEETFRPSVATVESIERDLARAQGRLATLEKRKAKAKRKTPALDRKIADERRIIGQIRERIAEAEQYLPRPERLNEGLAYSPYKVDEVAVRAVLPTKVRQRLGIPQKPGAHAFTGASLRSGRVGNVVKLTAQEELSTLRFQGRLAAWREAKDASITGRELLRRVDAGESLSDYAAVRVKPGRTSVATNELLSNMFGRVQIDSARQLIDVVSDQLDGGG